MGRVIDIDSEFNPDITIEPVTLLPTDSLHKEALDAAHTFFADSPLPPPSRTDPVHDTLKPKVNDLQKCPRNRPLRGKAAHPSFSGKELENRKSNDVSESPLLEPGELSESNLLRGSNSSVSKKREGKENGLGRKNGGGGGEKDSVGWTNGGFDRVGNLGSPQGGLGYPQGGLGDLGSPLASDTPDGGLGSVFRSPDGVARNSAVDNAVENMIKLIENYEAVVKKSSQSQDRRRLSPRGSQRSEEEDNDDDDGNESQETDDALSQYYNDDYEDSNVDLNQSLNLVCDSDDGDACDVKKSMKGEDEVEEENEDEEDDEDEVVEVKRSVEAPPKRGRGRPRKNKPAARQASRDAAEEPIGKLNDDAVEKVHPVKRGRLRPRKDDQVNRRRQIREERNVVPKRRASSSRIRSK